MNADLIRDLVSGDDERRAKAVRDRLANLPPDPEQPDDIAMQTRCVFCLSEQYAMAIVHVSFGTLACSWCGVKSIPMTEQEWRLALQTQRAREKAE